MLFRSIAPGVNSASYPQWLNQTYSSNFKRGIYTINVLTAGTGYNGGATGTVAFAASGFTISGNGTGLDGTITFGTGGKVQSIDITNPGSGYTFLTITGGTGGNTLVYDPIYSPAWGLGADPIRDLSAYYAIANASLNADENGVFTVTNSYRKIILVANPTGYNSTALATTGTLDATTTLTVGGATTYAVGAIVTDSVTGAKGRVVDWNAAIGKLRIIRTFNENYGIGAGASGVFAVGSTVSPGNGVISAIVTPTVQPGSGDILYAEYRSPITRSVGQNEIIALVLEF